MKKTSILAGLIVLILLIGGIILNLVSIPNSANIIYSIIAITITIILFFITPKNNQRH